MNFDIDVVIFVGFLAANIILGLTSSRGIKTIDEFAVGNRDFSTATIAATIIATWVSGDFFFVNTSETYKSGLVYSFSAFGDIVCILLIGVLFAPRMGEFLGKLSIAEAMGSLYGQRVRVITAVSGLMGVAGMIAVQLTVAGLTFEYAFGISGIYGVLSAGLIITFYSALGGIKSVTFTDVIQFFTFGTVIPIIAYVIFTGLESTDAVIHMLSTNPLFNYKSSFDPTQYSTIYHISLFFCFAIPAFNPAIFQRIAMAHDTMQVRKSFLVAAFTCFVLLVLITWISILIIAIDPNIESGDIVKHIINNYTFVGIKGLMLVGIMAMVMSTADSFVNATSVLMVHDFCVPLGIKLIKDELFSTRIASALLGVLSILLSLYSSNLIELLTLAYSFYMPIVTVPFIMAILGFRSSEKSVLIGMVAGLVTVVLWDYIYHIKIVNSVPPGMLANLMFLIGSHYIFHQPGGFVGIKDMFPVLQLRQARRLRYQQFLHNMKTFNLFTILKKNCPRGDGFISILGFFIMISVFGSAHSLSHAQHEAYANIIDILYSISICSSTALISYPLWLQSWKDSDVLAVVWNIIMFFILICFSFLMILFSNFGEIQLMVFLINILMLASIITWRWAIVTIMLGVGMTTYLHNYYIASDVELHLFSSQFKIVYLLLLVSSTLLTFLKPKQDRADLLDLKIDYMSEKIDHQKAELVRAIDSKNEFLRNIEHESRTPITGITSMVEVLEYGYDKFSDAQRKAAIHDIAKSSERFNSWATNLVTLSKFATQNYFLEMQSVNLGLLVNERLAICRKLYIDAKDLPKRQFVLDVEEHLMTICDPHYIALALDVMIVNAIQYCRQGIITLNLHKKVNAIEFSIKDEGIGIPINELYDIFGVFTTSSRTKSVAGGRGVGLALAKEIVEAHGGTIKAESNGISGAIFTIRVPS